VAELADLDELAQDVWAIADLLIETHPVVAERLAFGFAIESLNAGELEKSAKWAQVVTAIVQLQKSNFDLVA
jgi:hypothetical protein